MESGSEARVGEQRSGGGRKVQRTWLWEAAASLALASMGEGGMWWRLGKTPAPGVPSHRRSPRSSDLGGFRCPLAPRERRRRRDNRQQGAWGTGRDYRGEGTRGSTVREESREERRGEDRGGVATVDLSRREERLLTKKKTRGETFCSRIWGNGEMKWLPRAGGNLVREIFRKPSGKLKIGLNSSIFSWHMIGNKK
jgi:hypothetical protein